MTVMGSPLGLCSLTLQCFHDETTSAMRRELSTLLRFQQPPKLPRVAITRIVIAFTHAGQQRQLSAHFLQQWRVVSSRFQTLGSSVFDSFSLSCPLQASRACSSSLYSHWRSAPATVANQPRSTVQHQQTMTASLNVRWHPCLCSNISNLSRSFSDSKLQRQRQHCRRNQQRQLLHRFTIKRCAV
jgi:hypothetical protein